MNKLNAGHTDILNGNWNRELHRGEELEGKTIGIIGYGHNGKEFAKKLAGFDVECLAHDINPVDNSFDHVSLTSISEIHQKADVLSFHIPQNESTVKYFDGLVLIKIQKTNFPFECL